MSKTKISIDKSEKVVGMEKSASMTVEITGTKKLVDKVDKAVRKAVQEEVEKG